MSDERLKEIERYFTEVCEDSRAEQLALELVAEVRRLYGVGAEMRRLLTRDPAQRAPGAPHAGLPPSG